MPDYILQSDFSEAQIESDVSSYLAWCCIDGPFHLIKADEPETGADWRWTKITPIYIQFKKSTGLTPFPTTRFKPRKNASPLQAIRAFRQAHDLPDDPTLFFQLRKQAKTAIDLQHNILLAHHRPPFSHAIYVAPLYLRHTVYTRELAEGPRGLLNPWIWRDRSYPHATPALWAASRFYAQPFLRSHISITPHVRVTDHNHFYAYSTGGSHLSWHSPALLEDVPRRLSDFMAARARDAFDEAASAGSLDNVAKVLAETQEIAGYTATDSRSDASPIEGLRAYGRWLRETHGIVQLLLARTDRDAETRA